MNTKQVIVNILGLLVFFLVLVISPKIAVAAPKKFIVGISLPLSGDVAEYGIAVKNGIELARQHNPTLYKDILFLYGDNKYDGRTALSVFHTHHNIQGANLSFIWGDTPSLAVAPVAEKSKFPILSVLTDPNEVRRYNYVTRFISSRHECTDVLIKYFHKQGISKLALVYAQNPYNENYMRSLSERMDSRTSLTILGDFLPEAMDFRTSILKAKYEKFDALGLYLLPSQVRAFVKQAKTLDLQVPIYGMDVFQSKQTIEESGGLLENAVFPTNIVEPEFEQEYLSIYKDNTHLIYAANGYEFANTIVAIKKNLGEDNSAQKIINVLKDLPARQGAMGEYVFRNTEREGQHFQFPVVLKRIKAFGVEIVALK